MTSVAPIASRETNETDFREPSPLVRQAIREELEIRHLLRDHAPHVTLPDVIPARCGHLVYIVRDVDGQVLYVGVTRNLYRRLASHTSRSPWFSAASTISLLPCRTRHAAEALERRTITSLRPKHNIQG